MKYKLLFTIALIFSAIISKAQVTISSVNKWESRCVATGKIVINATGGTAPYQYALVAGPSIRPYQVNDTFYALAPGTYTVRVKSAGSVDSATLSNVVVSGSYTLLNPSQTIISPTNCSSMPCNGMIRVSNPNTGRNPLTFRLYSDAMATNLLQSHSGITSYVDTFKGLCPGTYTYQVEDSCGNIQTRQNIVMPNSLYYGISTGFVDNDPSGTSCDSMTLRLQSKTYAAPYTGYAVSPNAPLDTFWGTVNNSINQDNQYIYVRVPRPSTCSYPYNMWIKDNCGTVTAGNGTFNLNNLSGSALPNTGCTGSNVQISVAGQYSLGFSFKAPYTYQVIYPGVDTFTHVSSNKFEPFTNLPNGNVTLKVTDSCGITCSIPYTINRVRPTWQTSFLPSTIDSTRHLSITDATQFNLPITIKIISISGDTTIQSAINNNYSGSISVGDSIVYNSYTNGGTFAVGVFGLGTTKFKVTDACGLVDTVNLTLTPSDLTTMNFSKKVFPGCPGANKIRAYASTTNGRTTFELYRILPTLEDVSAHTIYTANNTALDSVTWSNLSAGTYVIKYIIWAGSTEIGYQTPDISRLDTVVIADYVNPAISGAISFKCPGVNYGTVTTTTTGGVAPFQYEITSPASAIQTAQANATFTNVPIIPAATYTLKITDACINSNTYNFSIDTNLLPQITANPSCVISSTNALTLTADTANASYSWTGPNSFSATGRVVTRNGFTELTDTGFYYLATQIVGCPNLAYDTIHIVDCSVALPLQLISFEAEVNSCAVHLSWAYNQSDNIYTALTIERSKDGINYQRIEKIDADANRYTDVVPTSGRWFYRLRFESANGENLYSSAKKIQTQTCLNSNVQVYPNPAIDVVNVVMQGPNRNNSYELLDALGRVILKGRLNANANNKIDVSAVPQGSYIIKVLNDTDRFTQSVQIIR